MRRLLFLLLLALPGFAQCTISTFAPNTPIKSAPVNANFASLNACKPQRFSGTSVPGTITGSLLGDFYQNTATGDTYQCFKLTPTCTAVASGNWVKLNGATGTGTVTVVGGGNLDSTKCVTGGGSQTAQTVAACSVDSSGNLTVNSVASSDTAHTGTLRVAGLTSGSFVITGSDAAGSPVAYVWPSAPPVSFPKSLQITGTVTCPTMAAGSPSTCYQLAWQ